VSAIGRPAADEIRDHRELGVGIGRPAIQRDDAGHAEVFHVLDVFFEIRQSALEGVEVLRAEVFLSAPPCILSDRTVATITAASGFRPPAGT
jgi:hypothetical protein